MFIYYKQMKHRALWASIFIFMVILGAYLYKINKTVLVVSKIDGIQYEVIRETYQQEAADRLAYIMWYMRKLVSYVKKERKQTLEYSTAIDRIHNRFPPKKTVEGFPGNSYLLGKSKKLVLSLRNKDMSFKPLRKIKKVAIHELAHMASRTQGHTDEFHKNYSFLLKMSRNCPGI